MAARVKVVVAAVCVLLCAVTIVIWVRSYFCADTFIAAAAQRVVVISSLNGAVQIDVTSVGTANAFLPPTGWYSNPMSSFDRDFLAPLYQFHIGSPQTPLGPGPMHTREAIAPLWSILLLGAILPAWIFVRGHKEKTWTMGGKSAPFIPALRWRVSRFAIFSAVGALLGLLFAWSGYPQRQQFGRTSISPELFALPGIAAILIVLTRRHVRWYQALLWMGLELAGFICFFEVVLDEMSHIFHGTYLREQTMDQILGAGPICFGCGVILLLLMRLRLQKRIPGPYCPQCGYCLIGLPTRRCTECGRPFTLEELGIDAAALSPAAAR
jgi:hypothetical protein